MMKLKAIWFAVLSITVFFPGMPSRAENPIKASPDRFSIAVECVKRFEGWHGEKKHWPYVGWGHKVLPGERFTNSITKAQGDSILRADLRKLCRMFSYLGRDSLIVSVLAYNVGCSRVKGYGKIPKSRLLKNWSRVTAISIRNMSPSDATRGKWFRASNGEGKWNICCFLRSK